MNLTLKNVQNTSEPATHAPTHTDRLLAFTPPLAALDALDACWCCSRTDTACVVSAHPALAAAGGTEDAGSGSAEETLWSWDWRAPSAAAAWEAGRGGAGSDEPGYASFRLSFDLGAMEEEELMGLCVDSTAFDAKAYYEQLITTASLPTLLKRENDLLTGECRFARLEETCTQGTGWVVWV